MRFLTPTPMNVRAVAIGLAVLVHLFVLLLLSFERRMLRREPARQQLQFVSIWPDPPPVQPRLATPPRPRSARAVSTPPTIAPVAETEAPVAIIEPAPEPQPVSPDPAPRPPVDWVGEGQKSAARSAEDYGKRPIIGAPPKTDLRAKLCKPRVMSKATQKKMDELLPPLIDPTPDTAGPLKGSVMIGTVRVGVIKFTVPVGKKGSRSEPIQLKEDLRPKSSVPDPNTCE